MNGRLLGNLFPDRVGFEALLEVFGEGFVQLDKIEAVVFSNVLNDGAGDGSSAGADFEDSDGRVVSRSGTQVTRHRSRKKPAAGSNRAGRFETFSKLAEKRGVLFE